jgi:hypothetical protein
MASLSHRPRVANGLLPSAPTCDYLRRSIRAARHRDGGAYLNLTVAYIEGGASPGRSTRAFVMLTKLAHIHFVTNEDARRRVLAWGKIRLRLQHRLARRQLASRVDTVCPAIA